MCAYLRKDPGYIHALEICLYLNTAGKEKGDVTVEKLL